MSNLLSQEIVLIVGAAGLLGASVTKYALEQGATVVAVDLSVDQLQARLSSEGIDIGNAKLTCYSLDLTVERDVIKFFGSGVKITGAVNCAYPRNKAYGASFYDVKVNDFNENVSLHLGSAFLFSQQCAKYFKRTSKPFSLVNISSIYGVVAPKFEIYNETVMTMPVEYAAIKSAILHLNKYVAAYVNDSRFRINSVSPGGIRNSQPEKFLHKYKDQSLGKGMLDIEDVLGSIMFLLSKQSKYINGQNIIVDDGFSL